MFVADVETSEKKNPNGVRDLKIDVEIDEYWLEKAERLPGSMEIQAVITLALREFLERQEVKKPRAAPKQTGLKNLLDLAGKIEFFEGFDPRAEFCGARPPLTEEEKKDR